MYTITRQIGIDAGHRVTTHGSKCKNLHGHRYKIEATCSAGDLISSGEQEGMVLDFGFLKQAMMETIDDPYDHGMILWIDDPWLYEIFLPSADEMLKKTIAESMSTVEVAYFAKSTMGKLAIVANIPTAENLAELWFNLLVPRVVVLSEGAAALTKIRVWETPNCYADYTP